MSYNIENCAKSTSPFVLFEYRENVDRRAVSSGRCSLFYLIVKCQREFGENGQINGNLARVISGAVVGVDLPGDPEYIKNLSCKHVGLHTFVDRILYKFFILFG